MPSLQMLEDWMRS